MCLFDAPEHYGDSEAMCIGVTFQNFNINFQVQKGPYFTKKFSFYLSNLLF